MARDDRTAARLTPAGGSAPPVRSGLHVGTLSTGAGCSERHAVGGRLRTYVQITSYVQTGPARLVGAEGDHAVEFFHRLCAI